MRRKCDASRHVDRAVGGQHIGGGPYIRGPFVQRSGRNIQAEQDMLNLADGCIRRKHAENMKTECRGELEPRQHQDFFQQTPVF